MVLFAHGLEGHPNGRKAQALRSAGFDPVVPDHQGLQLEERVADLAARLMEAREVVLVGSSYGGLAALAVAQDHADSLTGLVLCAPALHLREIPVTEPEALRVPSGLPAIVIHGVHDSVVPVGVSKVLATQSGPHVELVLRDDDHRLAQSTTDIVDAVRRLMRRR